MSDNNDNDDRTIYCGNLSEKVTEQILYELFFQVGPVERVSLPKDNGIPKGFGFVTFVHLCSVRYAIDLFYETKLFGRNLTLKNRNSNSNNDRSSNSYNDRSSSNTPRSSQSLAYGFNNSSGRSAVQNMIPNVLFNNPNQLSTQQFNDVDSQRMYMAQQQILLQLAGAQMFGGGVENNPTFPSGSIVSHNDRGGNKNDFVDRNRSDRDHQREHKPYSRNRSRSSSSQTNKFYERNQPRQKTRSRSPSDNRSGGRGGNRDGSNRYALWTNSNNNNNNNNYNNNNNNNNGRSRHRDRRY